MEDATTVNPMNAPEILERALKQAQDIVEATLSDEDLLAQIEPEFTAYWSGNGPLVHFLPTHFDTDYFLLLQSRSRWETEYANTNYIFKDHVGFGVKVIITRNDILPLLRDRRAFFANNEYLRAAITKAAGYVEERCRGAKSVTLFLALVLPSAKGDVIVFARGSDIRIKKKSGQELADSIYQGLITAQPCVHSEDLSTLRLLRRSLGYEFDLVKTPVKKIAIVGCGSLGGFVADSLARSDMIDLLLIDPQLYLPPNLARHVLPASYLYQNKAKALKEYLLTRFRDRKIEAVDADYRSEEAQAMLQSIRPDFVVFATGDTNTDITGALAAVQTQSFDRCFAWIEGRMRAGHIVFEPETADTSLLVKLHEGSGVYRFHDSIARSEQYEAGCQTAFTPYSSMQMSHFAIVLTTRILDWLVHPPEHGLALEWNPVGTDLKSHSIT